MENLENQYNPRLGEVNRYENARSVNKEFAEQINQEAILLVNRSIPVLEKLEENPENKNFHHPIAGNMWIGEYLRNTHNKIVNDLYGVSALNVLEKINSVPEQVINFLERTENI